jgi:excisionase family DNA binding protein
LSTDFKIEQWISQAEAARLRGVSRQAISKLVKAERIRSLEIGGHQLVFKEDVMQFLPRVAGRPKRRG